MDRPITLNSLQSNSSGRSCLIDLRYDREGKLYILIEGTSGDISRKKYTYEFEEGYLRGFLLVDEGDLIAFWNPDSYIPNQAPMYKVSQGSVFEKLSKNSGLMSVSIPYKKLENLTEYLLATDHECVLILSAKSPKITEN